MSKLLAPQDKVILVDLAENTNNANYSRRARLLLLLDSGKSSAEVGQIVGLTVGTVNRWRRSYLQQKLEIFPDGSIPIDGQSIVSTNVPGGKPKEKAEKKRTKMNKKNVKARIAKRSKNLKKAIAKSGALLKSAPKSKAAKKIKKTKVFKKASRKLAAERKAAKKAYKKLKGSKRVRRLKKQTDRLEARIKKLRSLLK